MTNPIDLEANITAKQAADILQCTVKTVHNLIKRGDLASVGQLPGPTGAKLLDRVQVQNLAKQRALPKK